MARFCLFIRGITTTKDDLRSTCLRMAKWAVQYYSARDDPVQQNLAVFLLPLSTTLRASQQSDLTHAVQLRALIVTFLRAQHPHHRISWTVLKTWSGHSCYFLACMLRLNSMPRSFSI